MSHYRRRAGFSAPFLFAIALRIGGAFIALQFAHLAIAQMPPPGPTASKPPEAPPDRRSHTSELQSH